MKNYRLFIILPPILCLSSLAAFSARPIDLSKQSLSTLQSFMAPSTRSIRAISTENIKEVNRSQDKKNTLHIRIQQMHAGYPVWGANGIVHIPKTTNSSPSLLSMAATANANMTGVMYQDLVTDLANTPAYVFAHAQAAKAERAAVDDYNANHPKKALLSQQQSKLMVYVDAKNKAHWVYKVKLAAGFDDAHALPARPVYMVDALTFEIYKSWDDIKTAALDKVTGGGFGGNAKMGKLVYDGLAGHLGAMQMKRNADTKTCYLQNDDVIVQQYFYSYFRHGLEHDVGRDFTFPCAIMNIEHGDIYWNDTDAANGGYSPANDAMFQGIVVKHLYRDWYAVDVLSSPAGATEALTMIVHKPIRNAYWDPDTRQMTFGDGRDEYDYDDDLYPFTSLGISAHEFSHLVTESFSDLDYVDQSGGINESFSDMAVKAAEVYVYGNVLNWEIGSEIFKTEGALRYMDKPSKDCLFGDKIGVDCSIDTASQYLVDTGERTSSGEPKSTDVHFSSGVFNRAFYLLATASDYGWDTRKAFNVMLEANMHYWRSSANFKEAACGVLQANKNMYNYNPEAIYRAFSAVGIDTKNCT